MTLKHTPLDSLHRELGARMVPFAGYDMPVQYSEGILVEHRHTRALGSVFDVSHMGQFVVSGPGVAATLESLMPSDLQGLALHRQCYALLTNDEGGVRDDLIVTRWAEDRFFIVVNAACKDDDRAWIEAKLAEGQRLEVLEEQALIAVQGPGVRATLARLLPGVETLSFLEGRHFSLEGVDLYVSCSGYTGEDGYEISCPSASAEQLTRRILDVADLRPAGLGARDSLRLEAGLCLYGHELSPGISPIEAGLAWAVSRVRRPGGDRAGGYPGAARIESELDAGAPRRRVGLRVVGRRPVREGQTVLDGEGRSVGIVTSGAFAASVNAPIAFALVEAAALAPAGGAPADQILSVDVRGKAEAVVIVKPPFIPARYQRL
ncbi:MAG: glycine cleavage system aminomethyltransferase GcvT [Halieaceae bacterium]|jgi:aminomethyltransferase|nr:glycine cleavage system aminomethyltransferase GcvT [Halieaceae bacterium]